MKVLSRSLSLLIVFSMLLSFGIGEFIANAEEILDEQPIVSVSEEEFLSDASLEEQLNESINVLTAIENLPDSVIASGPNAIYNWLKYNTKGVPRSYYTLLGSGDSAAIQIVKPTSSFGSVGMNNDVEEPIYLDASVGACVAAIGVAVLSNAIPIAKILKIKSALKTVGGATKLVTKLITEYREYRKFGYSRKASFQEAWYFATNAYGSDLRNTLLTLFNIGDVYYNCFG
ncbi:hypothetical protein QE429_004754 [Bacillus sp. SORGH_AS 510]|uniref:hypothetical protein n=1 Tax=Bacillus sp. SORGH_AS_0510 TaxID=3041771 RepID=UPI00278900EF|nr:hypothetical protein [Bacillus sp. SORGH_AS_0510]MDQ1147927.1 hypothetical protein [Bacillus sp. SORGH_AS_0510]